MRLLRRGLLVNLMPQRAHIFIISVFFEISRFFAYPVRISASAPSQVMLQAAANPSWMANTANISATPESPNFRIPVRVPSDTITVPQGSPGVPMEQVARSTEKTHHGARCRNRTVKNPGDHHREKYLCKHRTAVMDLCKNEEVHLL